MDKYKVGTIFQLYEDDEQLYVVMSNVELEKETYLLVTPVNQVEKNFQIDYSSVFLVKVNNETENISIETNKEIIKNVVNKTLGQIKNN